MTAEFLLFANLTLALRLRLLLADAIPPVQAWWLKCGFEVIMLGLLLRADASSGAAMAVSVMATVGALWCDRHRRDRNAMHLAIGLGQLVLLSFCLGTAAAPQFRPTLLRAMAALQANSALGPAMARLLSEDGLRILLGFLLVANEANLFIRAVLGGLQLKPGGNAAIDTNEYARGRVIGLLERLLIYFFVLNGQLGAVGFTLAAKAFTRFKELDNRGFAEYVLIGTLLSSGLAMAIAVAVTALR